MELSCAMTVLQIENLSSKGAELAKQRVHDMAAQKKKAASCGTSSLHLSQLLCLTLRRTS